jgi:Flp pilus assembly protein TadD
VTATEQAVGIAPDDGAAWARHAHALARTERVSEAIEAAERALQLSPGDEEVGELLDRLRDALPRVLPAA